MARNGANVKRRINKSNVDLLKPGETLWDNRLTGFGCRCQAKGKFYILKYRDGDGRQRWVTLGKHGEMTAEQARDKAERHRGEIAGGLDPAAAREAHKAVPTVREACELVPGIWAGC